MGLSYGYLDQISKMALGLELIKIRAGLGPGSTTEIRPDGYAQVRPGPTVRLKFLSKPDPTL